MKVRVIWGKDATSYAEGIIEVPDGIDDAAIIDAVRASAHEADNLDFEGSHDDWCGLRAVEIRIHDSGRVVAQEVPVYASDEGDLGFAASALLGCFSPKVEALLTVKEMPVPEFEPFRLAIAACDTFDCDDTTQAIVIDISTDWLRHIAARAKRLEDISCREATFSRASGYLIHGGDTLQVRSIDVVVSPSLSNNSEVCDADIWFAYTAKDREVQTHAVMMSDIIERAISARVSAADEDQGSQNWLWCEGGTTLVVAEELDAAHAIIAALDGARATISAMDALTR